MSSIEKIIADFDDEQGWNVDSMDRKRPAIGQPHTCDGIRGQTLVEGLTMRDIRDCFVRAMFLSTGRQGFPGAETLYDEADKGEQGMLSLNDLFKINLDDLDPVAISQNLGCEIEKMMGIWPNVPKIEPTECKR